MTTFITIKGTQLSQDMLNQKTTSELATVYNATMAEIDPSARKVERFATKEAAVRRVWGAFLQLAALEEEAAKVAEKAPKAKTPKQPKEAKPEVEKETRASSGERTSYKGTRLYPLVEENPRREGTLAAKMMQFIMDEPGISYEDYCAKGGLAKDLKYDIDRNRVRVER